MSEAFIIDCVRTARGKKKGGVFNDTHPMNLGAHVIAQLTSRLDVPGEKVDDVIMGCVTQLGEQGFNIARGAVLAAGLPITVPGVTINRFCGSGQQAVHFAAQAVQSGAMGLVYAGGVESMSRVAMGSDAMGTSDRNTQGPASDRLQERFPGLVPQGVSAEMVAEKWGVTRAECDAFALESQRRGAAAKERGSFSNEIVPMEVTLNGETKVADHDEHLRPQTTLEALAGLPAVFKENGVVTAGNASGIVDGASMVAVANAETVKALGLTPRARIKTMKVTGTDPVLMLSGPIPATRMALEAAGMDKGDVDLFEVNEAFASVPLAFMKDLGIPHDKVNVNGGAIALGHPLGATGGILFGTLLNELERQDKQVGLVTMCIGYGMGTATIIERV